MRVGVPLTCRHATAGGLDSILGAIQQLIDHPLVNDRATPDSEGAVEASILQAVPMPPT